MTTIADVIRGVRELTLDQFPQPAFLIKKKSGNADSLSLEITDENLSLVRDVNVASLAKLFVDGQAVAFFSPDRYNYTFYLDAGRPGNITFEKASSSVATTVTNTTHVAGYHKEVVITANSAQGGFSNTYTIQIFFRNSEQLKTLTLNGLPYDDLPMLPVETISAGSKNIYVPENYGNLESLRLSLQDAGENFSFAIASSTSFTVTSALGARTFNLVSDSCPYIKALSINGELVEGFFPEKTDYVVDVPVSFSGDFAVSYLPFIDNDGRHDYAVETDFSTNTHKILVKVSLDGALLNTYEVAINYTAEFIPSDLNPDELTTYNFSQYTDLISLGRAMKVDVSQPFDFDFWPTLTQSDDPMELQNTIISDISDEEPSVIYRQYFFSDAHYTNLLERYFDYYYPRRWEQLTLEGALADLPTNMFYHVVLWVSYWAVEDRRTYELASQSLVGGADNFDLSSNYSSLYSASAGPGAEIQLQIGSVFTIREDSSSFSASKKPGGAVAQVGADNILGDESSFWYKLQGFIRKRFEDIYRDYALRSNEVIEGYDELSPIVEHNFMAFFDQYPFRVSPYTRGLFGGGRSVTDSSANYSSGGVV